VEIINTNAVYIPSLDGKDIYISNSLDPKNGYRLKNKTGNLNLSRFINSLDYSLDLIKMRQVHKSLFPVADIEQLETVFSFDEKGNEYDEVHSRGKEYSCQVINVTFKYSNKEFNRVRGSYYIRFGYRIDDLEFEDCIAWDDGEIVGVQTGEKVNNPVDAEELPYFIFKDGMYRAKDNIKTCNNVADIRSDIYENGFVCEGIKYVRFKRSSGSSRVGKCLFINERLYDIMHEWEMCGIQVDEGQDIDLAALEPYIALTLSSIIDTIEIKPENILVVDDYKSVFHERAIATRLVDGRLVSQPEDVEISNSIWDGQSLMDRSLFGEYSNKGMLLLRARFFKSCCFNANIQQWFADHGIKKVSQLNGYTRARKIEDVKLITTPSSIKYLKFGTLDHWLDTLETTFGVVKYEKKTHFFDGRMVQTHYQLINTLQMTYEEVEQFIKPSLDYARMIKTDPAVLRHQISYQYCTPDEDYYTKAITSKNDVIYKILGMNEHFAKTKMYGNFCNDLIRSFIKNLRCGHVLVRGNYSTLCGNPIEMLKMSIGQFDGSSIIERDTVHCEMFESGKELLGSRSPHVTIGNILVTRNVIRPEIARYMNPTNEIVYVNSIRENLLERLSGADFDSDTMLLTDNEILVTAAKRNYDNFPVPTKLVESAKRNRRYTNREKADLDIKTSANKIGEIINLSQELNSILWDRINKGASVDDVMELYCDISQLDVMSNLEIDSAKRENPANNTRELQLLKKKYDVRDKKNRHVRPLFFKYIDGYKGYRDDYHVYVEQDDEFQKLFKTDKFKDAHEIKKHSKNNIVIERGRMSYIKHETSMDYLQKCINRFYIPRKDENNDFVTSPLTDIIIDPELIDPKKIITKKQRKELLNKVTCIVEDARTKCNEIWVSTSLTNSEKREQILETRKRYALELKDIQITEKQMSMFLKDVDGVYFGLNRFMFYLLVEEVRGFMLSTFYLVLQDSTAPISFLQETEDGDIHIYDFRYSKINGEGEKYLMYFNNQEEFADYVKSFLDKYGLKQSWVAQQLEISNDVLSKFLANPSTKKLSKTNTYNLLSFINKYIAAMKWLEII
jgi:hypothetical protein